MTRQEHLEAFDDDGTEVDFANEHEDTAVDPAITADRDDAESESPDSRSGLDRDVPP